MFVVDTNVLVFAANRDAPEHARCRARLEEWRSGASPWFTTWTILYEFVRVMTHPRVFANPLAADEEARGAAAIVAGYAIDPLADQLNHHKGLRIGRKQLIP